MDTFVQWLNGSCCPLTSAAPHRKSAPRLPPPPPPSRLHLCAAALEINDHSSLVQVAKLPPPALILLWAQAGFSMEGDKLHTRLNHNMTTVLWLRGQSHCSRKRRTCREQGVFHVRLPRQIDNTFLSNKRKFDWLGVYTFWLITVALLHQCFITLW